MSLVRRDAAVGTIQLHRILLRSPSIASVFASPTRAILAALRMQINHSTLFSIRSESPYVESPVICLTEIAINARITCGHNDATVVLFLEYWPCCLCRTEAALEMDIHNKIQILFGDFGKTFVPQNARVVHQNVDATKILYGRLNDFVAIGYRIVIGTRDTAYHSIKNKNENKHMLTWPSSP